MSEKFSPALRLTDLNDFIAPSQDCVVSLKATKPAKQEKNENREKVQSFGQLPQAEPVRISLKDCLACSGCITSAETIMLEKQSLDEFLAHTKSDKTVIVSISPQSRASLAAFFDLSPFQVFRKLTTLFKSLGVKAVYDTSCSRDLSLIESCNEFISRYQKTVGNKETGSVIPMLSSACPEYAIFPSSLTDYKSPKQYRFT